MTKNRFSLKRVMWAILLALFVVILSAIYMLVLQSPIPAQARFDLDMDALRELALSTEDDLPQRINSIHISNGQTPQWLVFTGGAVNQTMHFRWTAFQIVYPDETILLDPMHTRRQDAELHGGAFGVLLKPNRPPMIQTAMREASHIIGTHEHWDHIGAIAQSAYFDEIADRVYLTQEQLTSPLIEIGGFTGEQLARLEPLVYDEVHLLAPGVVLIKAPGHTPGSQFVYILLDNDEQFLFVGDSIFQTENLEMLQARPRAASMFIGEDHLMVTDHLRALHSVWEQGEVHIVPAHDGDLNAEMVRSGLLGDQFESVQTAQQR